MQQERANNGLQNTVAEEQRILADRQAELAKQERNEQLLAAVTAIWDSYKAYLNDPNTTAGEALQKAILDVGQLSAITTVLS